MVTRRELLLGTAGLAAGSLIAGCSPSAGALQMTLLEGSVPSEVLKQFRKQQTETVTFQSFAQMSRIFQQLQRWQQAPEQSVSFWQRWMPGDAAQPAPAADSIVSLGDYWLEAAIAQNLIEPLALSDETWSALPTQWQQFVHRDDQGQSVGLADAAGKFWAAPYKVQSLVVVYRNSQFPSNGESGQPFESWDDLLMPQLRQSIALPAYPNVVLGLLQKMTSGSFNASFERSSDSDGSRQQVVEQLSQTLSDPFKALNEQVKTYDAQTALKALVNEDVQVVVAWSGDVVTALQRYRDLRAVVPSEGSLLSADMWVQPKGAQLSAIAQKWIAFCWQKDVATQLSLSRRGFSPVFLSDALDGSVNTVETPDALKGGLLSAEALQNSEPLLPLPPNVQAAYIDFWRQLRAG